jgi:hypothetical protein
MNRILRLERTFGGSGLWRVAVGQDKAQVALVVVVVVVVVLVAVVVAAAAATAAI